MTFSYDANGNTPSKADASGAARLHVGFGEPMERGNSVGNPRNTAADILLLQPDAAIRNSEWRACNGLAHARPKGQ
jgi:hypothetical protein